MLRHQPQAQPGSQLPAPSSSSSSLAVPKKRLYMDRNNSTGSTDGTPSSIYDAHVRSPGEASSSESGTGFISEPENLSMKRYDQEESEKPSGDSAPSSTTTVPKVEDSINMKKFWEERLANGLYQGGLEPRASSDYLTQLYQKKDLPAQSSDYLASFQLHAEAELAALYSQQQQQQQEPSSSKGSPSKKSSSSSSSTGDSPISIRSFCLQEGNTYRCKVCHNAYTHPSNFHRHYVTTHLNRKSYPCGVCGKKFNRKDNMTAHLRAVHGFGGQATASAASAAAAAAQMPPPLQQQHEAAAAMMD